MLYDYLVVGAGLSGAVFAHEATKRGFKCLVIDKRDHIGGNIFTRKEFGIDVHVYGAHIFHTNDEKIWNYVSGLVKMKQIEHHVVARYGDKMYSLPFNMNTFHEMWGINTPEEAKSIIDEQRKLIIHAPSNLEEQAISMVGVDIYEKLIKGYTQKQWGKACSQLPSEIIMRLPVRFTFNNSYYDDRYQGIPENGYTELINILLDGSDVELGQDYLENQEKYRSIAKKVYYTGQIDRLYGYRYGALGYRSLIFKNKILDTEDYQGTSVVNYTEFEIPFTRIIEHKHFLIEKSEKTIITEEYPTAWDIDKEPYYPINDEVNRRLFLKYLKLANSDPKIIIGGRLGSYKYLDMDDAISECLALCRKEFQ